MDRHVEFATQLSRLVALHAHQPLDQAAERAALRAARAAAKHGAVELSLVDDVFRAGLQEPADDVPHLPALRGLFAALGIVHLHVAHQTKQAEIKAITRLLAEAASGENATKSFRAALAARKWADIGVEFLAEAEAAAAETAGPDAVATETVASEPEAKSPSVAEPAAAEPALVEPAVVDTTLPEPEVAEAPAGVGPIAESEPAEPLAAAIALSGPLATHVPDAVGDLPSVEHRELFERLITSSEPATLRRLLEPVQLVIEQSLREGRASEALQVLVAMFACEGLTDDVEMRRQFVVVVRKLTKPTVLRAFAMVYADEPQYSALVERVMVRFGEDGAEAVADRASCAPSADARKLYADLLGNLPGARDAVVAMLDDQRPHVVERAIWLAVHLRFSDADHVLGEQLSHASVRVRQAAARGLAAFPGSAFAADALLRAVEDEAPEVRLAATVALQARRESRLASTLVQRLDVESDVGIQIALITALGRVIAAEGVQKLIAMANPDQRMQRKRDASAVRLAAIASLGEARTPAAMIALQKLLEDRDAEVREAAGRLFTRARRQTTAASAAGVSEP